MSRKATSPIHGTGSGGLPFTADDFIAAIVLLAGFFLFAKRTFGKYWYAFRNSILD